MKKLIKKLRYFKFQDILAPFIFIVVLIPSLIFRIINILKKRNLWLICEDGHTARDNGYFFYKYIRLYHPDDYCFFVIDKNSNEYNKVKDYGNIIQFKSFKHWLFYLSAQYNISIHKHGNPCQSFFYILHVFMNLYNNRVFLQHGITKDDSPWIYYKNTKFRYFICGARDEYNFVKEKFGYPSKNVVYTGFARFDGLHNLKINDNQILIMPTWRNWMGGNYYSRDDFKESNYFKKWNSLLNNEQLIKFLKKSNMFILFYPHQHVQKFIDCFTFDSRYIKIAKMDDYDIQTALKESKLLITDYSSVFMDFAYMNKPVIFYQFDYLEYRSKQLQEGYYDYKDGFGPVFENENEIVDNLKFILLNGLKEKYYNKMSSFFELRDDLNCDRIYKVLSKKGE